MRIPNYKILKELGSGGMGKVYLAEHSLIGHKVAIKSLHLNLVNNKDLINRFREEAKVLAKMDHPGIVKLKDYLEQQDGVFLIMEYIEGIELSDHITKITGPIIKDNLITIFVQLLEAFKYAHKLNIVHRDIKPSNIIIDSNNNIKVLDFGIAKILEDTKSLTKTGTQLGTVYYMSPEQVKGDKNIDQRSDIYSLGVTLFYLACGRNPYNENETEYHILNKIVNDPLPKASVYYPGLEDGIENIIEKATSKNPKDRYQNCDEFIDALKKLSNPIKKNLNKTKVIESQNKVEQKKSKKNTYVLGVLFLILIGTILFFRDSNKVTNTVVQSHHILFKGKVYNSFIVPVIKKEIEKLKLLENINKVPHDELLIHLKKRNDSTIKKDSLFFLGSLTGFSPNCEKPDVFLNFKKISTLTSKDYLKINSSSKLQSSSKNKNGFFLLSNKKAIISSSINENLDDSIKFLIQGGPLIIEEGNIKLSVNKKDNLLLFGIGSFIDSNNLLSIAFIQSKSKVTEEELATFMKVKFNCKNAIIVGKSQNILSVSNLYSELDNSKQIACKYLYFNQNYHNENIKDTNTLLLYKPKKKVNKKQKNKSTKASSTKKSTKNKAPLVQPLTTVRNFLTAIDQGKFRKAYSLQKISRFSDEQQFCSSNGYGATDQIVINEIYLDKIVNNKFAYVIAKYVSFDPVNGNFEVDQSFQLQNINGRWIIIELINLKPAFKF